MSSIPVYSFEDAINKSSLDASAKLILYVLNSHARNNTKHCFLTVKTIASEASLSRKTVFSKFKDLESAGFLARKQQYKDNEQKCNIYILSVPPTFSFSFSPMTIQLSDGVNNTLPSETVTQGGCNDYTGGVSQLHTELINLNLLNLTSKEKAKNTQEEEAMKTEFEEFWKAYPRKAGDKKSAFRFYKTARGSTDHQTIMSVLNAVLPEMKAKIGTPDEKYLKHPQTWLNAQAWDDKGEIERLISSPQQSSSPFAQYEAFAKTANVSTVSKYS
jgi:DNA-binding Lrp family transcriptional regulator